MNMPFGLPNVKDRGNRVREGSEEITMAYEQKLVEYRNTLENYRKWLMEYSDKCEKYELRVGANKSLGVQTALDLTYLKEQGEKTIELMEDIDKVKINSILLELERLKAAIEVVGENLEGIDKNSVNRISELLIELQKQTVFQNKQYQEEYGDQLQALDKRVSGGHTLLWFVFILNLIGISGIVFLILYVLGIIQY